MPYLYNYVTVVHEPAVPVSQGENFCKEMVHWIGSHYPGYLGYLAPKPESPSLLAFRVDGIKCSHKFLIQPDNIRIIDQICDICDNVFMRNAVKIAFCIKQHNIPIVSVFPVISPQLLYKDLLGPF